MKRARRLSQRLVRWVSLCVCFALVLSCLAIVPFASVTGKSRSARRSERADPAQGQGNGQERRVTPVPPRPGPPAGTLPNLDDMRRLTDDARRNGARPVRAPQPVPSTQRRWRHGQPANRAAADSKSSAVKANHARGTSPTVRERGGNPTVREGAGAVKLPASTRSLPRRVGVLYPQGTSDMAMARIDPHNRTGTGSVDLLSNNFNWSLGLVGLKGRGLDLGLTLSYNSLATWTQSGNYVAFDMDQGTPSPGFRLGFPTVQGPYNNNLANTNFYILITPSGGHQELRQVGTSNVYQAVDATYSQLTVNSGYLIYKAGGAQLTFYPNPTNTEYHCTEVKDRNGNFLTINYQGTDDIRTVTDTLGRIINVNYDAYNNLKEITQTWNGQEHKWATFEFGPTHIGHNFGGLTTSGPDNEDITVLKWVGLPDGSKYYFDYDGSYGVVTKIRYDAYAGNKRRQTTYTFNFTSTDSPRVTAERDWAASWNGDTNETPATGEEAVTTFGHDGNKCVMTAPDGTVYKEIYGTGFQAGLTTGSEIWSGGIKKKWTSTSWTQENPSVSYLLNPRVIQTDIWDAEYNHKKTVIDYSNATYAAYSLPYGVIEYAADGTSFIRSTWFDYKLDQQYLDKRIIGLVWWEHVYDHVAGGYAAKTTYDYDEGPINSQATNATNHDSSYNTSAGRGNVISISRWDVTDINNGSKAHTSHVTYDAAGSVMTSSDALGHSSTIEYSDSFAYAYPTKVKDPDWNASSAPNNYSTVQYNFDTGAVTQTQGPPPAGQSTGAIQNMAYDSVGRLQWITRPDGFWRFIAYADRGDAVMSQVTIADYPTSAWSITVVDGADRTRLVGKDLPNSYGGYAGALTYYDVMGRVSQATNPTEATGGWVPTGDDTGWVFNNPTVYDWKGRPLRTYNMDGTFKEASYDGCGCAGGEVVTLTDEVGRKQKVYSDPLGRAWKAEILNWDTSVYSTRVSVYNGRDQVSNVLQYSGSAASDASSTNANASCPTGTCQKTVLTFDGYGRLQTKHTPEQQVDPNNSSSTDHTSWTYKNDDTIDSVTDARGASATYGYNNRHLVTGITYSNPSGVAATPNATFAYDAAGNRTSASSSVGTSSYSYDQLSRLTSESYQFGDISGTYTLNYAYNLGGELTSLSIPFTSQSIGYSYDSTGRLSSISASGFQAEYGVWPNIYTQSVTSFISSIAYRAWGAPKSVTYGNNVSESTNYNSRLEPTSYTLGVNYTNYYVYPAVNYSSMTWTYDYYADGRVNHAYDSTWNFWDRSYSYDHAGRLAEADTNRVARGQTWDQSHPDPYKQTWTYDVWNNLKRTGYLYNSQNIDLPTYTNNRRADSSYDANGNITAGASYQNTFDVFGSNTHMLSVQHVGDGSPALDIAQTYAADGRPAKRTQIMRQNDFDPDTGDFIGVSEGTLTSHYIHSSVLGARVVEIDQYGQFNVWVYAGGKRIATANTGTYANTTFEHHNPVTGSYVQTNGYSPSHWVIRQERDPMNAEMPLENPGSGGGYASSKWDQPLFIEGGDPFDFSGGCTMDGFPISCSEAMHRLEVGSASFSSATIVSYTYNGHRETHVGYSSLPPGIDLRATGRLADAAWLSFGIGMEFDGFAWGAERAFLTLMTARHGGGEVSRALRGDLSFSFAPQDSGATERALSPEQGVIVWNALRVAWDALKSDRCRQHVGEGAAEAMRTLWDSHRYTYFPGIQASKDLPPSWAETGPGPGWFSRIRTALNFQFFDDQRVAEDAADFEISPIQDRALTLLHEVRHYLCPTCRRHEEWDDEIVNNCFK